uniref:Nucleotidyl transferase AbiEii/AbiGii toxin family protein n=1 Tax=Thermodesulfobacterium geofontis TaxID=1295609 RepID=A0A7C4P0I5_9BACT
MDEISNFWEILTQIFEEFNNEKVSYCIVGGIALNLYGIVRRTLDVDLFIKPESENLKKTIKSLKKIFKDQELEKLKPSDFYTYSVIRYGTPQGFYVDLITKFGEAINWETVENTIEWINLEENLKVPVASLDLLIKMKETASLFREKDKVDLFYLKKLKEFKNKEFNK